jgi:hypothetical protein
MLLLITTMLSTGSLAAFTASAPQARPIRVAAVGGIGPTAGFSAGPPPSPAPGATPAPVAPPPGATAPGNMPRGSLLDLSV